MPERQINGRFEAGTLLFADISGFTSLSETLHEMEGKEGSEELVRIINTYLDLMLGILFKYDGQLVRFGGDAMLCLFTGRNQGVLNAVWAAWEMKQTMEKHFAEIEVFQEIFPLSMKVGKNSGLLFSAVVGSESHLEYILTGSAVERTAQAESAAGRGEIVISQTTYQQAKEHLKAEQLPDNSDF